MLNKKEYFQFQEKPQNMENLNFEGNIQKQTSTETSYQNIKTSNNELESIRKKIQAEMHNEESSISNIETKSKTTENKKTLSLKNLFESFLRKKTRHHRIVNDPATSHDSYYDED